MPADVAALDAELAAATSTLAEAVKVRDAAETADTHAAQKVRAFRPRHELLTLRQQWDELAEINAALPDLEAGVTNALTVHGEAKQATEAAEQHTERLRAAAERAADTADQTLQAVTTATEQTATLATVTVPDDLAELTAALTALRARHEELNTETAAAEDDYATAKAALGSAPSEATLSTGRQPATVVHDTLTADLASWDDREQAASALVAATTAVVTATAALGMHARPWTRPGSRTKPVHCAPTCSPGSRARSASSRSEPSPPGTMPATLRPRNKSSRLPSPVTTRRQRNTPGLTATPGHDRGARRSSALRRDGSHRTAHRPAQPPHCWRDAGTGGGDRRGGAVRERDQPGRCGQSDPARQRCWRRSARRSRLTPPAPISPGWPSAAAHALLIVGTAARKPRRSPAGSHRR